MEKKEFLDEKIIELLDQVETYTHEQQPMNDNVQQEQEEVVEQSLETYFVIDRKQVAFERKIIIENKLTMMLPKDFTEMTSEVAKMKYPSEERPNLILTDPSGTVNFWVSTTEEFLPEKEIENVRDQMFSMIQRLNPGIKPQQSGVEQIMSKTFAYIEYSNPAIEGKVYNLMFIFTINDKMTIACFNCSTKEAKYWKSPMFEMMKSMVFTSSEKEGN